MNELNYKEALSQAESSEKIKKIVDIKISFSQKLQALSWKTYAELSAEEKRFVDDAKNFAELLQAQKEQKDLYLRQSQDLLKTLKANIKEVQEVKTQSTETRADVSSVVSTATPAPTKLKEAREIQIHKKENEAISSYLWLDKKDVDDINLASAIKALSKVNWDDKASWEKAWYKADWFFWPSELSQLNKLKNNTNIKDKLEKLNFFQGKWIDLLSIINSISTIENNWKEKVLESLCDLDWDGKIDQNLDKWLISWKEILDFIEKNKSKETEIIKNISLITWVDFNDKISLFKALKNNPTIKYTFFSNLYFLWMAWANLRNALIGWQKGISDSITSLWKNLEISEKLTESLMPWFEAKYNEVISNLKQQISSETDTEKKNKLSELLSIYEGDKKWFLESFRVNMSWLWISLIQDKKWLWVWANLTNDKIDKFIKEKSNELIKSMQINLWFSGWQKWFIPWIWINFTSRDFKFSEDTKALFDAWLFLTTPYLIWTLKHNYNSDDIKNAWFKDFSTDAKNISLTWNISTLANWITLWWSKDKLQAIEKKEQQFKALLDDLITKDTDAIWIIWKIESLTIPDEDKKYLKNFAIKIGNTLNMIWFDKLNLNQKILAISWVKNALLNEWKTWLFIEAQKGGFEFTWAWIWLQFIAWILPIITLWVQASNHTLSYEKDNHANARQRAASPNLWQIITTSSTKTQWKEVISSLEVLKNREIDLYLQKNVSKFDWSKNDGSPIAMRNPRDYPKFLNALKWWKIDEAFNILKTILKTDVILKNDKETKEILSKLDWLKSSDSATKSYVVAQFMDVMFKDKNSIEKVINTDTLWKGREKWLKWVYNNEKVYTEIKSLRNTVKNKVKWKETPESVSNIMWFVASYKIWWEEWKAKSLWKAEAVIPPGLATAVWWKNWIEKITDNNLIDHTIANLEKTPFYDKLKISLWSIISKSYPDFTIDDKSFNELLKTWELKVWDKVVKLNRDFVFFLYGRCANETLWLEIKWLDLWNWKVEEIKFNSDWEISINRPIFIRNEYNIWVVWGGEEKSKTPVTSPVALPQTSNPGHIETWWSWTWWGWWTPTTQWPWWRN